MYKITRLIFLLILVGIMLLLPTANASAALVRCRTDPVFLLSNGDVINVTLDIDTDPANIRDIAYVVRVPAGVTVTRVTYTAINMGLRETYQVYQNSPEETYTTDTVVTTRTTRKVAVTAMTRLNSVFAQYASGFSGQHLIVTVSQMEPSGLRR